MCKLKKKIPGEKAKFWIKHSHKLRVTSQIASNTESALTPAYLALYKINEDGTFSNTCMQLTPIASHPFLAEELHKWPFRKPHRWESTNIKPSCLNRFPIKCLQMGSVIAKESNRKIAPFVTGDILTFPFSWFCFWTFPRKRVEFLNIYQYFRSCKNLTANPLSYNAIK